MANHAPRRVLVADDDAEMRVLVVEALSLDGYEVSSVADGGRLLITLARGAFDGQTNYRADLVVSDVRMPVCDGLAILRHMRAAHWRVPVILTTAFGDANTREETERLGAVLLDKPFELGTLRRIAGELLRPAPRP
jgi:CheY-like chemotaxis protein